MLGQSGKRQNYSEISENQAESHLSVAHLLCGKVSLCVMFLLGEDNCKHSVRAAAGFVHVGGCHSPKV